MKKFLASVMAGLLILSLSGCSAAPSEQRCTPPTASYDFIKDVPSVTDPENTAFPMKAIVLHTVKESVHADDGAELVSLSFQRAQIILHDQDLEEKIISDFQSRTEPILSKLSQIEAQAQLDYPENEYWSEYFIDLSYTPTRLDQAVLSLFGNTSSYCGGPHPSLVTDSVTYDLHTGEPLCIDDILTPECRSDTIYQLILKNLEKRAEDLYYDYADVLANRFTGELRHIQDWYFSRSGLCFHFAPYDIAPYSSGTVIAELPYSSLAGILQEKYFPSEPLPATGSMYAETITEDDNERFTYIADVSLCEEGNKVLLYPDATVTDIRIESGFRNSDNDQYIAAATIFAASTMNVGDAICLTDNLESEDTVLRLIYHSGGQEYSSFITYDSVGDSIALTNG